MLHHLPALPPHPTVRLNNPFKRYRAEVDFFLADLIRAMWQAGMPTILSCQDRHGRGRAWVRLSNRAAACRLHALALALDPAAELVQHSPRTSPKTADVYFRPEVVPNLTRLVALEGTVNPLSGRNVSDHQPPQETTRCPRPRQRRP